MLPVASEGLQPLEICPVMKGHLQVEGWIQEKNAEPTEAEKAAMLQEEQRLMQWKKKYCVCKKFLSVKYKKVIER